MWNNYIEMFTGYRVIIFFYPEMASCRAFRKVINEQKSTFEVENQYSEYTFISPIFKAE